MSQSAVPFLFAPFQPLRASQTQALQVTAAKIRKGSRLKAMEGALGLGQAV